MLYRSLAAACAVLIALISFTPPDARAALQVIDAGLIPYAAAFSESQGYAIAINNAGQVIGRSEESPGVRWGEGMIWQPAPPGARTGALHSMMEFFGSHVPNRGERPNGIGERGEFSIQSGATNRLFVPDVPNGLTGRVISNWQATIPNTHGVAASYATTALAYVDLNGTPTPLAGGPGGADVYGINDSEQIVAVESGRNSRAVYLWTPDGPGSTAGSTLTLDMPTPNSDGFNVLMNNRGEVVKTTTFPNNSPTSAYLYRPSATGGSTVALDDLLGVPVATVLDLNNNGQMLTDFSEDDGVRLGSYLLTPDGNGGFDRYRLDLLANQRVDANTLVGGFYMTTMNDNGQLAGMAGWSFDNGATWQLHSTVLTVPEPELMLIALLPMAAMLRRRA
ncbi:MAG: hypothetical protein JWM57_396 [Phycisphaerales bacterium]|nr:hypothetical protein [Phycisphaerales bacterium]